MSSAVMFHYQTHRTIVKRLHIAMRYAESSPDVSKNIQAKEDIPNPPPNFVIRINISGLWSIPDHQQGIRCKASRSDD